MIRSLLGLVVHRLVTRCQYLPEYRKKSINTSNIVNHVLSDASIIQSRVYSLASSCFALNTAKMSYNNEELLRKMIEEQLDKSSDEDFHGDDSDSDYIMSENDQSSGK